jgi:hypothetical protein
MRACLPTLLALSMSSIAVAAPRVRLAEVGKDSATLHVALDAPAAVEVAWGEQPGAFTATASSPEAESHDVRMTGLSPDRQYFYEVRVAGAPATDLLTFTSGRTWVTRRAVVQVTADAPSGAPGEAELAETMFADAADALVVLGAAGEDEVAALHPRSATDRVVRAIAPGEASSLVVSDVAVAGGPSAPAPPEGTCWHVGAGDAAGLDVQLAIGSTVKLEKGTPLRIVLADPESAKDAPRAYARLAASSGKLVVELRDAAGKVLDRAELAKDCPIPKPDAASVAAAEGDPGDDAGSSELEADTSDCGTH